MFKCKFPSPGRKHCRGESVRKTKWPYNRGSLLSLPCTKTKVPLLVSKQCKNKDKFTVLLQTLSLSMHKLFKQDLCSSMLSAQYLREYSELGYFQTPTLVILKFKQLCCINYCPTTETTWQRLPQCYFIMTIRS